MSGSVHIGTMGWSYTFWRGNFYPEDLPSAEFLSFYAKQLNTVEVDNTFYRIPRTETVTEWKDKAPKDFLFSLKFPQKITHFKMLRDSQEETNVFLERVSLLGEKLGVLLLQFPPMFTEKNLPILKLYLKTLPKENRYAVEVRNKSLLTEKLYSLLREQNVALAWVDSAKMPASMEKTAGFIYVRWEGDRKAVTGTLGKVEVDKTSQIEKWAEQLKPFAEEKTKIFGYFSKYFSGLPTSDARQLTKRMRLQ